MSDKPKRPRTPPTGFPVDRSKVAEKPVREVKDADVGEVLAWRVKACYSQERERWESCHEGKPVKYKPLKKYDGMKAVTVEGELELRPSTSSTWAAVARWCRARGIPPEQYIRVCFAGLDVHRKPPEPRDLLSDKYLEKWTYTYERMPKALRRSLKSQISLARSEMTVRQVVYGEPADEVQYDVLTDSHLELTPLFRHCIAASIDTKPMRRVARIFLAEAVLQYACYSDLYADAWEKILPEGFGEMADKLYPVILIKLGRGRPAADVSDPDSEE